MVLFLKYIFLFGYFQFLFSVCITKDFKRIAHSFEVCNDRIITHLHSLSSSKKHTRSNVIDFMKPYVHMAFFFNDLDPYFVLSTPLHLAEGYIENALHAIFNYTIGIWALDIVLDASYDGSYTAVLKNILQFAKHYQDNFNNDPSLPRLCEKDICELISIPTRIRLIHAPSPLWECKADNLVFSSYINSNADFYISVQADQVVLTKGWNLDLAIPVLVWPDDVLSVSARCAHNLRTDKDHPTWNEAGFRCNTTKNFLIDSDYRNGDTCCEYPQRKPFHLQFHIRDSSNRGPLLFHGPKLRELNFMDEINFLLSNDDHDLHARAFAAKGYLTGYYPVMWRQSEKKDVMKLKGIHHDIDNSIYRYLRDWEVVMSNSTFDANKYERHKEKVLQAFISHRDGGLLHYGFRGIKPTIARNTSMDDTSYLDSHFPMTFRNKNRNSNSSNSSRDRRDTGVVVGKIHGHRAMPLRDATRYIMNADVINQKFHDLCYRYKSIICH